MYSRIFSRFSPQILRHSESHPSPHSGFKRKTTNYFNGMPYLGPSDCLSYARRPLLQRSGYTVARKPQHINLQPFSRGVW